MTEAQYQPSVLALAREIGNPGLITALEEHFQKPEVIAQQAVFNEKVAKAQQRLDHPVRTYLNEHKYRLAVGGIVLITATAGIIYATRH